MYSVVLAMALSGGAEVPDFGGRGCRGCNGCSGRAACHGGGFGCHGCRGGRGFRGCHGCSGAVYAHGCHGGCNGGVYSPPASRPMPPVPPTKKPAGAEEESEIAPPQALRPNGNRAILIVTLPADARLSINGKSTESTSGTRRFVTPALNLNSDYVYEMTADMGQGQVRTQRIRFRAGQEVPVTFNGPGVP